MRLHRDSSRRYHRHTFRPRVEALEGRLCLSVTATVVPIGAFNQLKIVADDVGQNDVTITDAGTGAVSVAGNGGTVVNGTSSATNVSQIVFDGLASTNVVNYDLTGAQTVNQALTIKLGSGGSGTADVDLSPGVQGKKMNATVTGTVQDDEMTATIGPLSLGAIVNVVLNGGNGTNGSHVNSVSGGADIDANSSLSIQIIGGSGVDTADGTFESQVIGKFSYTATGGAGAADVLAPTFAFDAGSTGKANLNYSGFEAGGGVTVEDGSLGELEIAINRQSQKHDHHFARHGCSQDNFWWSYNSWGGWNSKSWSSWDSGSSWGGRNWGFAFAGNSNHWR